MKENDQDSENDISNKALKVDDNVLSKESRNKYEKVYRDFMEWKMDRNTVSMSEDVLLAYFEDLSRKFKSVTLLNIYSMLKGRLNIKHEVDISKYCKLNAFLKRNFEGYQAKQAKMFTQEEIDKFLEEAPNKKYLLSKICLIFGIMGACRRIELYNLKFKDVQVVDSSILVHIHTQGKADRSFTLTGIFYDLCKKYMDLRPSPCREPSFFLHYLSGKCYQQKIGINKFGRLSKAIAIYLELPEPELYTGNCYRKTSTNLLTCIMDPAYASLQTNTVSEDNVDDLIQSEAKIPENILNSIKNKKIINNLIINIPNSSNTEQGSATVEARKLRISNCTIENLYVCTK